MATTLLIALIAVLFFGFWIVFFMIGAIREPSRVAQKMGYVDWKEAIIELEKYREDDPNAPLGKAPGYLAASIPYEVVKDRQEMRHARVSPPPTWKTAMLTMPEDLLARVKEMIAEEESKENASS